MESIEIRVYVARWNQVKIRSLSKWFDTEYVIITQFEEGFKISKPDIDFEGKTQKVGKSGNYFQLTYLNEIEPGVYHPDEYDSTEDELVIYYDNDH